MTYVPIVPTSTETFMNKFWRVLFYLILLTLSISCLGNLLWGQSSATFLSLEFLALFWFIILATRRAFLLWKARKQGVTGSRLHLHLVILFGVMSFVPASLMMIFSGVFFNVGVESWLGKPIKKSLTRAQQVAQDYLKEHQDAIKFDLNIIMENLPTLIANHSREALSEILSRITEERGLSEIMIFDTKGHILAKSHLTFALIFDPHLVQEINRGLESLSYGAIHIIRYENRVRALARINQNYYLFIGRIVGEDVQRHVQKTKKAIATFERLSRERGTLLKSFVIIFGLFSLALLAGSIWVALVLSNKILYPIRSLIRAAEKVSQGLLETRVRVPGLNNEIDTLASAFNRMVSKLRIQKNALVLSQRKAAWADVARTLAHEIKNPLTPIQLSAERLKKRYLKEVKTEPQVFAQCIDTIIRHVGHIETLVREFSSFARMPEARPVLIDIIALAKEHMTLLGQAYPHIHFHLDVLNKEITWSFDPQQISQVFTNLIKNAIHAVQEAKIDKAEITLRIRHEKHLSIIVEDNGPGFPSNDRESLLEPYYTTRKEGTGLGLAIVARIVMEHHGTIELKDRSLGGAQVVLKF